MNDNLDKESEQEYDSAAFDIDWDVDVYEHQPLPKQIKRQDEPKSDTKPLVNQNLNNPPNVINRQKEIVTKDHSEIVSPVSE